MIIIGTACIFGYSQNATEKRNIEMEVRKLDSLHGAAVEWGSERDG